MAEGGRDPVADGARGDQRAGIRAREQPGHRAQPSWSTSVRSIRVELVASVVVSTNLAKQKLEVVHLRRGELAYVPAAAPTRARTPNLRTPRLVLYQQTRERVEVVHGERLAQLIFLAVGDETVRRY